MRRVGGEEGRRGDLNTDHIFDIIKTISKQDSERAHVQHHCDDLRLIIRD